MKKLLMILIGATLIIGCDISKERSDWEELKKWGFATSGGKSWVPGKIYYVSEKGKDYLLGVNR